MLARIGPVRPFLPKSLIAHSGGMRPRRRWTTHALAKRRMRRVGDEPGHAKGTHMAVSAVSAEIAGGTVPTRPA